MLTVTETPVFQSMVEAIWTPSEREDFAVFISEHPLAGDVSPTSKAALVAPRHGQTRRCEGDLLHTAAKR